MMKVITDNFEKTADAVLVEKYFGSDLHQYDNFIGTLVIGVHKDAILAECQRREEAKKATSSK